jgi:hypothetical protein
MEECATERFCRNGNKFKFVLQSLIRRKILHIQIRQNYYLAAAAAAAGAAVVMVYF